MVYGIRQVTNIVICGQPQLYVMENILFPSRIIFLNDHVFHNGVYKDNLVSISTGVVAPNCVNVDCAVELWNIAAVRLINYNFADVKLKKRQIKSFQLAQ